MEWIRETDRIYTVQNGTIPAEIDFPEISPGICNISRTFVDESLRGQGIAGKLMELASEHLISSEKKAKASCSYAAKWLEKHPETAEKLCWQENELHAQLKAMGLNPTDTVMFHSSLRAIGPTQGGAEGLISALCSYFSQGLLLIPAHTWANVNKNNPVYDAAASVPCIGTLPRIAAFHPNAVRSLHPTHSVAAFGKRAAEYIRGEELASTPAPPAGCWGRLYDEGAKILLAGVTQNRNTFLHSVEERIGVPDRLSRDTVRIHGTAPGGFSWEQEFHYHCCSLTNDVSQFYPRYLPAFLEYGGVQIGTFGSARTEICDARRCADVMQAIWNRAQGREIGVGNSPLDPVYYANLGI